jgi:hypothetical protein
MIKPIERISAYANCGVAGGLICATFVQEGVCFFICHVVLQ